MPDEIGTLAWARRTGGTLNVRERMQILVQAANAQVVDILRQSPLGDNRNGFHIDLDSITIPDSAVAQRAVDLCESVSSASLANHCMRTYIWGATLAQVREVHD
jgi:hypothetical protein